MQAILKYKYQQFCEWLQDVKRKQGTTEQLDELEEEMVQLYFAYLQKVGEVRDIITDYEQKQKDIRTRIKLRQRKDTDPARAIDISRMAAKNIG